MVRIVAVDSFQLAVTSVQDVGYCCPQRASIKATTPCVGTSYGMFAVLVRSKGSKPPNHQLVTLPTSTIHHCPDIYHYNLSPNASCLLHEATTSIIFYFFFFFKLTHFLFKKTSNGWCPCSNRSQRMRIEAHAWEDSEAFIDVKVVKNGDTWGSGGRGKDKKSPTYVPCMW